MSARRLEIDAGSARGRRVLADLCRELDDAVRAGGMSYAAVGRAVGMSGDQVARICRGESRRLGIVQLATLLAAVGLALSARTFPIGDPIRDRPQLALLDRGRREINPATPIRFEVPVVPAPPTGQGIGPPDRRAWDAVVVSGGVRVAIEAETRLGDMQALLRRLELKRRDGDVDRLILLLNDTVHNRRVVEGAAGVLRIALPGSARRTLRALRGGRPVEEDALLFL